MIQPPGYEINFSRISTSSFVTNKLISSFATILDLHINQTILTFRMLDVMTFWVPIYSSWNQAIFLNPKVMVRSKFTTWKPNQATVPKLNLELQWKCVCVWINIINVNIQSTQFLQAYYYMLKMSLKIYLINEY